MFAKLELTGTGEYDGETREVLSGLQFPDESAKPEPTEDVEALESPWPGSRGPAELHSASQVGEDIEVKGEGAGLEWKPPSPDSHPRGDLERLYFGADVPDADLEEELDVACVHELCFI